ncbi:hypothetical protein [Flavobacterium psychrophilum]|uniref:hypothetical protein n=1 Tax=Flavobacterium psychrophilum TaxID=96345 RepID=UPI0006187C25|nr:hypothetical protein [Flavobacterium psychrophilum]OAE93998.1 hypothetical protein SU65_01435 [Flavobacterium psychrophilum]
MNTKPITEFNIDALKNINNFIKLFEDRHKKVEYKTDFTHDNFDDKINVLSILLDAISVVSYNGSNENDGLCGGLADIAKKFLPYNEAYFLNSLLIKKDTENQNFIDIKK